MPSRIPPVILSVSMAKKLVLQPASIPIEVYQRPCNRALSLALGEGDAAMRCNHFIGERRIPEIHVRGGERQRWSCDV